MIRGFFVLLEILLLIISSIVLIPISYLLHFIFPTFVQRIAHYLTFFFSWLTLKICGTNIEIIGRENLPNEPCLYVSNHRSYFDIIMTMTIVRKPTFYIAKTGVGKIPILHFWMLKMKCLLIERDNIKQGLQTILKAIEQIKDGYSCYIYPEGTRTKGNIEDMLDFKEGSFKPAIKTNCPICPITILNSRAIFENQAPKFKKAHCKIIIDKPIYVSELQNDDKKFIGKYTRNIILENIIKYK